MDFLPSAWLQAIHHGLTLLLAFLALSLPWRLAAMEKALPAWRRREWLLVACLVAAATLLRILLPPHTVVHSNYHGTYFLDIVLSPLVADPADLAGHAPYGMAPYSFYHFFWAWLPPSIPLFFNLNAVLAALTVGHVYLLLRLLDTPPLWAFASAFFLLVFPAHIKGAPTENHILLSSFFALAALGSTAAWLRSGRALLLAAAVAWSLLTIHSRILTLAFPAALVGLGLYVGRPALARLRSPATWVGLTVLVLAALPQYVRVAAILASPAAEATGQVSLLRSPAQFVSPASNLLLNPTATSPVLPLLALAGLAAAAWLRRRLAVLMAAAIAGFALLYLLFSGHHLAALRYQFFLWPFIALPVGALPVLIARRLPGRRAALAVGTVTAAVMTLAVWPNLDWVTHRWAITEEFDFVREAIHELPTGSRLLEGEPIAVQGRQPVPAFLIPHFLAWEARVRAREAPPPDTDIADGRWVAYVGLQSWTRSEFEENPKLPRLQPRLNAPGIHLEPLITTTIDPEGFSPGHDLVLPDGPVTIGFYRIERQ